MKTFLNQISNSIQYHGAKVAFCIQNQVFTYQELGAKVATIQSLIRNQQPAGSFIGIMGYDAIQTYAAIIAVWMEGYAFVPLSPQSPLDRNENILKQLDSSCIISCQEITAFEKKGFNWINTQQLGYTDEFHPPSHYPDLNDLACILFTSGSTGVPKGVPYTFKNIDTTLDAFFALDYNLTSADRFLQMFELTFDMSMLSYLPALCIGAGIYTVPHRGIKYLKVYEVLSKYAISFAALVPSTLALLRPYFKEITLPALRVNMVGGEPFYIDLAKAWMTCIPNARVINISGPCETTMACVGYELDRNFSKNKTHQKVLAFGNAWKNTMTMIVDEHLNPVSQGDEGELCFAGENVMVGYWNRPELNKAIFFETEYKGKHRRFYRSGDMAFQDETGLLFSCGRKDYQYKIQGHKVELGEIEQLVVDYQPSLQVAATIKTFENGLLEIHLFVSGQSVDTEGLRVYLQGKLPAYMIPKQVHPITQLPRTLSGKIDRGRLKDLLSKKSNLE